MDPLDIHGSIHGSMDVDVPLGSMDVDATNIHGYPSSAFTDDIARDCVDSYQRKQHGYEIPQNLRLPRFWPGAA